MCITDTGHEALASVEIQEIGTNGVEEQVTNAEEFVTQGWCSNIVLFGLT